MITEPQCARSARMARRRFGRRSGMSLLEVTIALAVVTTVLLGSAGAFSSSLAAVDRAKRMGRAAVFLETVMEDLSAQPYDDLPAFNGNRMFDHTSAADSQFSVGLSVFQSRVDLMQIDATVTDIARDEVVGGASTLRSRR